jgi:hypothetical protein
MNWMATRHETTAPRRPRSFVWQRAALVVGLTVLAAPLRAQSAPFPESWVGTWRGTLTNYGGADSIKLTVPVVLTIVRGNEPGAYRMRHVYNNDTTRGMKDYTLRTVDAAAGRYVTDENNGILIDETWTGGMLVGVFQVGDQVIESRSEIRGDSLVQDLIFWRAAAARTTNGSGPNGERGAPVLSFRVAGRQRSAFVRSGK